MEARRLNKAESWMQLQADLMHNSHLLCPFVMPYKDLLTAAREIEDFCKGSVGHVGKSNEELLGEFLRGDGALAASTSINIPTTGQEAADMPSMPADNPINAQGG